MLFSISILDLFHHIIRKSISHFFLCPFQIDLKICMMVKIALHISEVSISKLGMQPQLQEENPYVMDTMKRFSMEEQSRLSVQD